MMKPTSSSVECSVISFRPGEIDKLLGKAGIEFSEPAIGKHVRSLLLRPILPVSEIAILERLHVVSLVDRLHNLCMDSQVMKRVRHDCHLISKSRDSENLGDWERENLGFDALSDSLRAGWYSFL